MLRKSAVYFCTGKARIFAAVEWKSDESEGEAKECIDLRRICFETLCHGTE